ncbi:MAG: hypothetical protein ABIP17_16805 [Ilumatobacteraceae bacterium]
MTDQIDPPITDEETQPQAGINRRRMFLAGAGIASAAALTKVGTAEAADPNDVTLNEVKEAITSTGVLNTGSNGGVPGTAGNEALYGEIDQAVNGSHAIRGITVGTGHAVAGETNNVANTAGATWGRHRGSGPGVDGVNVSTVAIPIAGDGNGVRGTVTVATNGSHAVKGVTQGGGHSVAGDTPATAAGAGGVGLNSVAATWGRHGGGGAGVGGVNTAPVAELAGPARGVEGAITSPTNGSHAVFGTTNGAGHSVAGETPAMVPEAPGSATMVSNANTTAATWGKHNNLGAGIGGISIKGYGGEFVGGKASVRLIPSTGVASGAPSTTGHLVGELVVDGNGDLYYNDGTLFTKLNGQTGGTVILNDIQRAYDSREEFATPANKNKGRHRADEVREINLTEFSNLPASASGAIINVTVADTDPRGFALVYNGDTKTKPTGSTGSSVNWVDAGEFVANGITVAVSATGTVNVYTLTATEVIIDVVGYIS